MDLLRSCYSTKMQVTPDPADVVDVDWFFTDADALPFTHTFGSDVWNDDHCGYVGVGEVYLAPRVYRRGTRVGDGAGTASCNTAQEWLEGLAGPGSPAVLDVYGTPLCCPRIVPPAGMVFCPDQNRFYAASYEASPMSVTDGSCACTTLPVWPLDSATPCTWTGAVGTVTCVGPSLQAAATLTVDTAGSPHLSVQFLSVVLATWTGPRGWDGVSKVTLTRRSEAGECHWPLHTTLSPVGLVMPPVGGMFIWGGLVPPPKALLCDGSAVSRVTYADLFAAIGTSAGPGDGVHTFNVPSSGNLPATIYGHWWVQATF